MTIAPRSAVILDRVKRFLFAYALVCACMWGIQRQLLYLPQTDIRPPSQYGLNGFTDVRFDSSDGMTLQAWHHKARDGYPTLIYFHGNGGNLGSRVHYFHFLKEAGFGLLALSYRGYGESQGSPSEQGFYKDARAAIAYAADTLAISPGQMIFYGESLGTGVAVQMSTEYKSGAVVLQSPYTSIVELGQYYYPWLPVSLLLMDRFDSIGKIANAQAPILLMHGEKDTVVPVRYGRALFNAAPEPKQAFYMPESDHVRLDFPAQVKALLAFCRKHRLVTAADPVEIIR